jgi:sucrose phosphorylase
MINSNSVSLMTYPDSLGGNLANLNSLLEDQLKDFDSVHILPAYPSTADRGFCPVTHLQIDSKFGSNQDIINISKHTNLELDLISNHISDQSEQFQDVLSDGKNSKYFDLFLPFEKIYPDGASSTDLLKLTYLRSELPLRKHITKDNQELLLFQTFGKHQIDLNLDSEQTWTLLETYIQHLSKLGTKLVRLDAIEHIVKHKDFGIKLNPKTILAIDRLQSIITQNKMQVLLEAVGDLEFLQLITSKGNFCYDFALSDLILYTVLSGESKFLVNWLELTQTIRHNLINVLTNHDGFVFGKGKCGLPLEKILWLKQKVSSNSGPIVKLTSGLEAKNMNDMNINTTLLESLGKDKDRLILAMALQIFAPGIPQIYYHDLLMATNNSLEFERTGEGRSCLRSNFSLSEAKSRIEQYKVQEIFEIIKIRRENKVFTGKFESFGNSKGLTYLWTLGNDKLQIDFNLVEFSWSILS